MLAECVSRRILLVDDDDVDLAESLSSLLRERRGHEVRIIHDGPTAIEAAKEFQPEVVFMDIGLPGMSGYDVARRLRPSRGRRSCCWSPSRDAEKRKTAARPTKHALTST